jgi:hypothetical protein
MVPMMKRQKVQVVAQLIGVLQCYFQGLPLCPSKAVLKVFHVFPTPFLILRTLHCAFCTLGCGLLFGFQSFLFFFSYSLFTCFSLYLFIYLFLNGVMQKKLMETRNSRDNLEKNWFSILYNRWSVNHWSYFEWNERGPSSSFCAILLENIIPQLCGTVSVSTTIMVHTNKANHTKLSWMKHHIQNMI